MSNSRPPLQTHHENRYTHETTNPQHVSLVPTTTNDIAPWTSFQHRFNNTCVHPTAPPTTNRNTQCGNTKSQCARKTLCHVLFLTVLLRRHNGIALLTPFLHPSYATQTFNLNLTNIQSQPHKHSISTSQTFNPNLTNIQFDQSSE